MEIKCSEKILVISESKSERSNIIRALKQIGFAKVNHATSKTDALKKLHSENYALIVADLVTPNKGLALLDEIRGTQIIKNVPFIMVSPRDELGDLVRNRHEKNSLGIARSFSVEELYATIIEVAGDVVNDIPRLVIENASREVTQRFAVAMRDPTSALSRAWHMLLEPSQGN